MSRRFSDFYWLQHKLAEEEKYRGCVFPPLPGKAVLGKNSADLVERRKQELQLYLQILAQHPVVGADTMLRQFLACENPADFERLKAESTVGAAESSSLAVSALRRFQIKDSFNYLYSSIKSRIFAKGQPEPADMQTPLKLPRICEKIAVYLPVLEKQISILEKRIAFHKAQASEQEDLANMLEDLPEDDLGLERTLNDASEFYVKRSFLSRVLRAS